MRRPDDTFPFRRAGAWIPPPWPFPTDPAKLPACWGERFFPGYPLAQDPIGYALSTLCAWDCDVVHGPEPVFGPTLDRQLDALRCDYVFTSPDTHPERVRWDDRVRRVDVVVADLAAAGARGLTWELARLPSPSAGIVAATTIETWLRFSAGAPPAFVEVTGMADAGTFAAQNVSPFAMPILITNTSTRLRWRWELIHELYGEQRVDPLWLTAAPPELVVRGEDMLAPWTDNRYGWGSQHVRDHHLIRGGHGLVRLYCTIAFDPPVSPTAPPIATLELAGSLVGYFQSAGVDASAVRNNTHRW